MRFLVFVTAFGLSLISWAADPEIIYHDKDFLKHEKRALAAYLVGLKITPGSKIHVTRFDRDKANTDYVLVILGDHERILVIEPSLRDGFSERGAVWFPMSDPNAKAVSFELLKDTVANQEILYVMATKGCAALYWTGEVIKSERLRCRSSAGEYLRERSQCFSDKGEWHPMGLGGYTGCTRPTRDAGKACNDSSQCDGPCLYAGENKDADGNLIGACKPNDNPFGCFSYIKKGQRAGGMCAD